MAISKLKMTVPTVLGFLLVLMLLMWIAEDGDIKITKVIMLPKKEACGVSFRNKNRSRDIHECKVRISAYKGFTSPQKIFKG